MNKFLNIFLVITFYLQVKLVAENPDSTIIKIIANHKFIEKACNIFNIKKSILSSIIFVERRENYTCEDDALDEYLAQVGLNSSIGFCQVKLKTAYWIEHHLRDSNSIHFPGTKYQDVFQVSNSTQEIIDKLQNDSLNIMYAAAYLRIMISRWEKEGFPINQRPDILGTLYSAGLFYRDGTERRPNKNPKPNNFGKMVLESMCYFKNF